MTEKEFIERNAALSAALSGANEWGSFEREVAIMKALEEVPTADAKEVKHGAWVERIKYYYYSCSLCGYLTSHRTNYCPDCGAEMSK